MVQQIIDSNFNKHGLPNTGTGLPNHDKQVPLVVTTKKIVLRDVQNESRMTVPKSVGSSLFSNENGPQVKVLKLSGTERPAPECLGSPPHHHSPTSNAANGNLVYVRRRPELELAKSGIFNNASNDACYPQARGSQDENTEKRSQMNRKHWEERYSQLQDLLKLLDQSNQDHYVQVLHSLPSLELSRHAVELEKRSIELSLEEAKEMQRVQLLDVLGKYSKNSRTPSAQQGQPEK